MENKHGVLTGTDNALSEPEAEMGQNNQLISLKIQKENGLIFTLSVDQNLTIKELKSQIETRMIGKEQKQRVPEMQLTINDRILSKDNIKLNQISLIDKSVIYVKFLQGNQNLVKERYTGGTHLNRCRILQRNFEACIAICQASKDPTDRIRFNEAETPTPKSPTSVDGGQFVRIMANSLITWAVQLHRLSDQLIRDEQVTDSESEKFKKARRLIQNNMDAARYMAQELSTFSQLVIPLKENPPRRITIMKHTIKTPKRSETLMDLMPQENDQSKRPEEDKINKNNHA